MHPTLPRPAVTSEKHGIWIVDDHRTFAANLARVINTAGELSCESVFHSCEDLLEAIRKGAITDTILMDIGLPGMSGIEGIRRVKQILPTVQVIMLTVFEDDDSILRAISAGASGYLHKSATSEQILSSLRAMLLGGVPMNPRIARKILDMFVRLSGAEVDYGLTDREREVLQLLIDGLPKKAIADRLFVSFHTVDSHLRNIYAKLQVNSRSSAVAKVLKERLL